MARAIKGDYDIPRGLRELDSEEIKNYVFVDKIGNYKLYNLNSTYDYILCYFEDNKFKKIAKIYFNKIDEFYEVDTIYVSPDMRKREIASKLYIYFVKELNYKILGSDMQRFGARRLWSKLSKREDLRVHIIDFENNKVLVADTEIYHGLEDKDFDSRVWCSGVSKKHIRLILRNK